MFQHVQQMLEHLKVQKNFLSSRVFRGHLDTFREQFRLTNITMCPLALIHSFVPLQTDASS